LADTNRAAYIHKQRRLAYARFGAQSGVQPHDCLHTKRWYLEEADAEKRIWPNLGENNRTLTKVIRHREHSEQRLAKRIEMGMQHNERLMAHLNLDPAAPRHVPAIRRKLIDEQKMPLKNYVVTSLTDEQMITDMAERELDPRSLEFKSFLNQIKSKRKAERGAARKKAVEAKSLARDAQLSKR